MFYMSPAMRDIPGIEKLSENRRGSQAASWYDMYGVTGVDKYGNQIYQTFQYPLFVLTPQEREFLVKKSGYLLGIITSRMNRISSIEYTVCRKVDEEDRIIQRMKDLRAIYTEYADNTIDHIIVRAKAKAEIGEELPDLLDDMSNFDASIRRWTRRQKQNKYESEQRIVDWIEEPNPNEGFADFQKMLIYDLMVHGAYGVYKYWIDNTIEDVYTLPGGTIYPLRSRHVGPGQGYAQLIPFEQPKIYFRDEISFQRYIPTSYSSYGLVPLDALINLLAEDIFFERQAAKKADGTAPPKTLIVFGERSPFGSSALTEELPMPKEEQKRIDAKLNQARKEAIATLSGVGQPIAVDLSKSDIFGTLNDRQDKILKKIALVYNMSPLEVGLTGAEDTSGRSTSESQERIEKEKGLMHVIRSIDRLMNKDLLPYKFGGGWLFEHKTGMSEFDQVTLDGNKKNSGTYTVNEIREARGDDPLPGEEYDKIQESQPQAELGSNLQGLV